MNLPIVQTPQAAAAWRQVERLLRHSELMANARGFGNDDLLATLISSQSLGYGVLPADFGLGANRLALLLSRHFPKLDFKLPEHFKPAEPLPEHDDLVKLMLRHRAHLEESEYDLAVMVASACRGKDHLWQDLGLNNRNELSELLLLNFPGLALQNDKNMKWKKFLYKQLCAEEGIYVCRAPSCQECKDLNLCFGSEDRSCPPA